MNQTIVQFYPDATKSLIALTNALLISAAARTKKPFYLALSGGETARSLFEIWKNQYNDPKRWKNVHFFWVDERCVSSENEESNYHWAETGEVILASREILIALVGERKKELLHRLVARKDQTITPATYILSHTSRATIFTEIELNSKELSFQ